MVEFLPSRAPSTRLAASLFDRYGRIIGRWGPDEDDVGDVPRALTFTTGDPGGFKDSNAALSRRIDKEWPDLNLLGDIRYYGAGDRTAWEGRIQETPRRHGGDYSVSPGAVGHVVELDDDPSFAEIYVDRDLGNWGDPSVARQLALNTAGYAQQANKSLSFEDSASIGAGMVFDFSGIAKAAGAPYPGGEFWYYGGGVDLARIYFDQRGDATMFWAKQVGVCENDVGAGQEVSPNYSGFAESLGQAAPTGGSAALGKKYGYVQTWHTAGGPYTMTNFQRWLNILVIGQHGLTLRGTWPDYGVYGHDVMADIVGRTAPRLRFTTGAQGTIRDATFVIPQLSFSEGVKGSDAVLATNAYFQRFWGVYDDRTFFWLPTTTYRKRWRIRRSRGHGVDLLGPQAEDAMNGLVVGFTDPSGQARRVGPPGASACYATSDLLADDSPTNPVNAAGIARKWGELQLGFTTDVPGAIQVGYAYLRMKLESATSRGSVTVTGVVQDDESGAWYPAWYMRAGDSAIVTDGDNIERRIIETTYNHDGRQLTANMDSTPHKVEALMERMGVVLVGVAE